MADPSSATGLSEQQGSVILEVFGRTDVGQIREHNEDNFLVADLTRGSRSLRTEDRHQSVGARGTVLGVCDGMGGAAAGEVASQLAVDIIYEQLLAGPLPTNRDDLAWRLVRAVEYAGVRIFSEARSDRSRRGMGTTATVAALLDHRLFVAQVGDSRAYLLRNGSLCQITRDQSLVNQLIEAGQLTEEEAENFEHNNIILQALGTADTVQVDLTFADLQNGDVLLICSDGLSGMIRGDEIREILMTQPEPIEACRQLTERANQAGGHDNITVIVARFDGDGLARPRPDDAAVGYRKYTLPDGNGSAQIGGAVNARDELGTIPPRASSADDPGHLRVGNTMLGATAPPLPPLDAPALPSAQQLDPPSSRQVYRSDEDPVDIPTKGLAPSIVGLMVLSAMLLVAVTGFFLLR